MNKLVDFIMVTLTILFLSIVSGVLPFLTCVGILIWYLSKH